MESVRGALAAFAADDPANAYPLNALDYAGLQAALGTYGLNLPTPASRTGISTAGYTLQADGTYSITVVTTATAPLPSATFTVTLAGIANAN
jgi:hypothetical protein